MCVLKRTNKSQVILKTFTQSMRSNHWFHFHIRWHHSTQFTLITGFISIHGASQHSVHSNHWFHFHTWSITALSSLKSLASFPYKSASQHSVHWLHFHASQHHSTQFTLTTGFNSIHGASQHSVHSNHWFQFHTWSITALSSL